MSSRATKKWAYRKEDDHENNKIIQMPEPPEKLDKNTIPLNVFRDQNQLAVEHELESPEVSEDEKEVQDLPSNNGVQETEQVENPEKKPELITTMRDPITGIETPVWLDEDLPDIDPDEYFKHVMESDTLSEGTFSKVISSMFSNDDIPGEDVLKLMETANAFLNKKPFKNGYYQALPQSIRNKLIKSVGSRGLGMTKILEEAAKSLLHEISLEYIKNDDTSDLDNLVQSMQKAQVDFNDQMSALGASLHISTITSAIKAIETKIESYRAEGKTEEADAADIMLDALKRVMSLEDFKTFCHTSKVKAYELERPDKVFREFNMKYKEHRLTIYDISICPIVIKRHIHCTDDDACKVCIAFCKYCKNMNPDNVRDHTFMYYFIKNIVTLDEIYPRGVVQERTEDSAVTQEIHDFYMDHLSVLQDCINYLNRKER